VAVCSNGSGEVGIKGHRKERETFNQRDKNGGLTDAGQVSG